MACVVGAVLRHERLSPPVHVHHLVWPEGGPPPHVVVLDIGLPRLGGLVVAGELTGRAHTRNIPIVVVTGTSDPFDEQRFAAVLRKPVEASLITGILDRAADRAHHTDPADGACGATLRTGWGCVHGVHLGGDQP